MLWPGVTDMPQRYEHQLSTSAIVPADWTQVCAACKAVMQHAIDRSDLDTLRAYVGVSSDTLARMLRDDLHGGWVGARIQDIAKYESQVLGTARVVTAQAGQVLRGEANRLEATADQALVDVLDLASRMAALRVDGFSRDEAKQIVDTVPRLQAAIAHLFGDALARLNEVPRG